MVAGNLKANSESSNVAVLKIGRRTSEFLKILLKLLFLLELRIEAYFIFLF